MGESVAVKESMTDARLAAQDAEIARVADVSGVDLTREQLAAVKDALGLVEPPPEPPPSPDEFELAAIEAADDLSVVNVPAEGDNPYGLLAATVYRSKKLGREAVWRWRYQPVEHDGRVVGYEGGPVELEIRDAGSAEGRV